MNGDILIGQNEYGELVKRKVIDRIRDVFIISQGGFNKVYEAHLKWYNKFDDKLRFNISEEILEYSEDNCKRYNHKSFLEGLVYFINKKVNNENIIFSYENVIIPKYCNLQFAELYNSKLENKDFNNVYFNGASFKGSYLSRVNFEKSYFNGADFKGAILSEVNFNDGNSYKVNFEYTNLEQINFNINLREANFKNAALWEMSFKYSDLSNANFDGAYLFFVNLEGAFLGDANFKNADLSDAVLYSESLKKVNPETKEMEDKNEYQHPDVNFQGATLRNVDLSHIQGLTASQIAGADLTCAKLPQNLDNLTEVIKSVNETIRNKGILSKDLINFLLNIFLYALLLSKDFTLASIPFHETYIKVTYDMLWMVSVDFILYFLVLV